MTKNNFSADINEDLYLTVTWAKQHKSKKSNRKVIFSGDIYTKEGIKLANLNRLSITTIKDDNDKEQIFISSMPHVISRPNKEEQSIYSITWFPKCNDPKSLEMREAFTRSCVRAVLNFIEADRKSNELAHLSQLVSSD